MHELGVIGSEAYDMTSSEKIFTQKIVVSQDVINWLNMHDLEREEGGPIIYIVNKIKYQYLGIEVNTNLITGKKA